MRDLSPAIPASRVPASTEPTVSGPAVLRPLRIRDFRLLFTGETVSVLGEQFHFVALAGWRCSSPAPASSSGRC